MPTPPEPKRISSLDQLDPRFRLKLNTLLAAMRRRGYDPIVFESRRSKERQAWLYGVGRTHSLHRKPVTWTLDSKHFSGKAADIISKSRGWGWPEFYAALRAEAIKAGLSTLRSEQCHVQM